MHWHDDSEKIQRSTPQKFLVVSDLVAQICPCLRGAKMRCCNRWALRFAPFFWGQRQVAIFSSKLVFFQKMKYTSKSKLNIVWTCCNRENHVEAAALPSGNQTQHLKIHHCLMIFSCKSPCIGDFPLPHLITCDYWREFSQRETHFFQYLVPVGL